MLVCAYWLVHIVKSYLLGCPYYHCSRLAVEQ